MTSGSPTIILAEDAEQMATLAAERLIALIEGRDRPSICLTGGSSPVRLYRLLATTYAERIPWDRTHWFIGDDRFVDEHDPLSNIGAARRSFLDTRAPAANIHAMPTTGMSLDAAAAAYERDLQAFYGATQLKADKPLFDLVLLGLGGDGHVASLFPGTASLDVENRWVVPVPEAKLEPFVPRISLTFPALASSREILFQISGASKKSIATQVLNGSDLPASRVHSQGETVWMFEPQSVPDNMKVRSRG